MLALSARDFGLELHCAMAGTVLYLTSFMAIAPARDADVRSCIS